MGSDAMRRIMAEVKELSRLNTAPNALFHAAPLETDLFEWHFTVRGPPDTAFAGGIYHGRILLPSEYPLKPPEIILLTPNGRFETGKPICLSVTSHHQETWQPSWGVRTILTALIGFMPSKAEGIGSLSFPNKDRCALARRSLKFHCPRCGAHPAQLLPPMPSIVSSSSASSATSSAAPTTTPTELTTSTATPTPTPSSSQPPAATADKTPEPSTAQAPPETPPESQPESQVDPPVEPQTGSTVNGPSQPVSESRAAQLPAETPHPPHADLSAQPNLPAPTEPPPTEDVMPPQRAATRSTRNVQEPELLYLAYAIAAIMVAVIIRRVLKLLES